MLTFSLNSDITTVVTKGDLADNLPTTDEGRLWYSEVFFKALDGKIKDSVRYDAYGYTCEKNSRLNTIRKEEAMLTVEELNSGLRGVADSVASYVDDNISTIVDNSAVQTALEEFHEMVDYLLTQEGVNLQRVLELALQGKTDSVATLRHLIAEYSMGDIINEILSHDGAVQSLRTLGGGVA